MYWILYLFIQNSDAVLSLPTEVKVILIVSIVITLGTSIIRKAWKLAKIIALVALAYFLLTTFGII